MSNASARFTGPGPLPLLLVLAVAASWGCTFDFKQFPTEPPSQGVDSGDLGFFDGPDAEVADLAAADEDMGDAGVAGIVGIACDDDTMCGSLSCIAGMCTAECTSDASCPNDTRCARPAPTGICAVPCDAAHVCAAGFVCSLRLAVCLRDQDADGTSDLEDNCVTQANAPQTDLDGDGIGDACDDEPACASGHVDGVLTQGPLAYPATAPSVPEVANHWLLAAGGRDSDDGRVGLLGLFDARSGATVSTLPYAADRFGAVQLRDQEYVLTPGDLGQGAQFGRLLHVYRDGSVRQGVPFEPTAFDPVLAAGAGERLFYLGYVSMGGSGYGVYRFDARKPGFVSMGGGDDGVRVAWHATSDVEGRVYFYSAPVDLMTRQGRWIEVGPDATSVAPTAITYPDVNGTFDPLFSPAPGGGFYVWDRTTGQGFTYFGGAFVAVPELDIPPPFFSSQWVSQPAGPGLHVVGSTADDPGMLSSVSYSLACMPALQMLDSDRDGVIDPLDLCPMDPDSSGPDTDLDWIGDACDPDADGDGIDDAADPAPGDTDNDGLLNADDDDDDADGISDDSDPFPLDTDNDGIRNAVDEDDDDDGYRDIDEIAAGSNPLDPLHFPSSGTLAWVDAGVLVAAPLQDLANPLSVPRIGSGAPSSVRFDSSGQVLAMLDGAPGATMTVELAPLNGAGQQITAPVTLFGVDISGGDGLMPAELAIAHERAGDPTQSDLSRFVLGDQTVVPIVTVLTDVRSVDISGAELVFTAQPQGCDNCRAPYLVDVTGTIPRILAPMVSNPSTIRYNGGAITLLGDASDGNGSAAWFGSASDPSELRPPGAIDVTGAVGFADGLAVVAATSQGGDALWLWNTKKESWRKLVGTGGPVTELDWAR